MRSRVCNPLPSPGICNTAGTQKASGQIGSNQKAGDHLRAHQALVAQSARKIFVSKVRPRHLTSRPHGRPPIFFAAYFSHVSQDCSPGIPALQTTIMAEQSTKLASGSLCLYERSARHRSNIAIAIISSGATFNTEGSYPTPGKIS